MELLESEILRKGKILPGNVLKVGSFINNQIDVKLMGAMAKDVANHFKDKEITKVLTVEASGIAFGYAVASEIGCDLVFAKKSKTINVDGETYSANCFSYTHKTQNVLVVPKDYIRENDKVLIADDFLATGEAINALSTIVNEAGAKLVGISTVIEKGFQKGGDNMRNNDIDVYSLAVIDEMSENGIVFRK